MHLATDMQIKMCHHIDYLERYHFSIATLDYLLLLGRGYYGRTPFERLASR